MEKYKLKVDARRFFNDKYYKLNEPLEYWDKLKIPIQLLDEVDLVYVDYGIKTNESSQTLCGYKLEYSHFNFKLVLDNITYKKYNSVEIHKLMDEIQKVTNKYFKDL